MQSKDELLAELADIKSRLAELNTQYQGQWINPDSPDGQEWTRLEGRAGEVVTIVDQMDARQEALERLADDPRNTPEGSPFLTPPPGATRGEDIFDLTTIRTTVSSPEGARHELQERAKRFVDTAHFPHPKANREDCQAHLAGLLATVRHATRRPRAPSPRGRIPGLQPGVR